MCGRIRLRSYTSSGKARIIVLKRINNSWGSSQSELVTPKCPFLCVVLNEILNFFFFWKILSYILHVKFKIRLKICKKKKSFMIYLQDKVLVSHHVSHIKQGENPIFYILFNLHLNKIHFAKPFVWEIISRRSHCEKRYVRWKICQKEMELIK